MYIKSTKRKTNRDKHLTGIHPLKPLILLQSIRSCLKRRQNGNNKAVVINSMMRSLPVKSNTVSSRKQLKLRCSTKESVGDFFHDKPHENAIVWKFETAETATSPTRAVMSKSAKTQIINKSELTHHSAWVQPGIMHFSNCLPFFVGGGIKQD